MTRGARILLLGGGLAMTGCVTDQNYHVRAIADPAAKFRYAGSLIAQGRGQLALGNVGLALETFRKAQREQPPSADTFAGIAACYAAMGRYDIARANYEFALAYAPTDHNLLTALANSLEQLGEGEQAAQVRAEASRLAAAPAGAPDREQAPVTPVSVPRVSSITVALPAPSPVLAPPPTAQAVPKSAVVAEQTAAPAIAAPRLTPPEVRISSAALMPKRLEWSAGVEISAPTPVRETKATIPPIAAPKLSPATVKLSAAAMVPRETELASNVELTVPVPIEAPQAPAPKVIARHLMTAAIDPAPVSSAPLMRQAARNAEVSRPAPKEETRAPSPPAEKPRPAMPADRPPEVLVAQVEPRIEGGPYLERLSLGEVSLVTRPEPVRIVPSRPHSPPPARTNLAVSVARVEAAPRLASADAVRWMPLKYAPPQPAIQLLNAARTQSLAARMRVALLDRGWRKIHIGNARKIRQHSLVLYASARWAVARRLAAHFGCRAVKTDKVQNVVVLLGRDASLPRRTSARA